jgi:hypothetical protein
VDPPELCQVYPGPTTAANSHSIFGGKVWRHSRASRSPGLAERRVAG